MTAPVDLSVIRAERKEKCLFCGGEEHVTELMCPRVEGVEIDQHTGAITAVHFWAEYDGLGDGAA